jgi:hypothetical protein
VGRPADPRIRRGGEASGSEQHADDFAREVSALPVAAGLIGLWLIHRPARRSDESAHA